MRPLGGIVKPYSVGLSGGLAEVALELRVYKRPARLARGLPPLSSILVERPIDDFKNGRRNMWRSLTQGIADSLGKDPGGVCLVFAGALAHDGSPLTVAVIGSGELRITEPHDVASLV